MQGDFCDFVQKRDVLLLEPKKVRGLVRWGSSFNYGHKEKDDYGG